MFPNKKGFYEFYLISSSKETPLIDNLYYHGKKNEHNHTQASAFNIFPRIKYNYNNIFYTKKHDCKCEIIRSDLGFFILLLECVIPFKIK